MAGVVVVDVAADSSSSAKSGMIGALGFFLATTIAGEPVAGEELALKVELKVEVVVVVVEDAAGLSWKAILLSPS